MRVKIRGMNDAVQINGYQGEALLEVIRDSSVPRDEMLKIGDFMIKKSEIIAVLPDTEVAKQEFKYDLSNPEHREIINQFREEFEEFVKNNPDKCFEKDGLKVGYKEHWRAELGITTLGNEIGEGDILDPDRYKDFQLKWSALQDDRIYKRKKEGKLDEEKIKKYLAYEKEKLEPIDLKDIPF